MVLNKKIFEIEIGKRLVKKPSEKWVGLGGYHFFCCCCFLIFVFVLLVLVFVVAVVAVVFVCLFVFPS